jgi:hypothetical protein
MVGWETRVQAGKGRTAIASVCVSSPAVPPSCFKTTAQKNEFQLLITRNTSSFRRFQPSG